MRKVGGRSERDVKCCGDIWTESEMKLLHLTMTHYNVYCFWFSFIRF